MFRVVIMAKNLALRAVLLAALACAAQGVPAATCYTDCMKLPDLPAPSAAPPDRIKLNGQNANLANETPYAAWSAGIAYPTGVDTHLDLRYGTELTSRLAAGASVAYGPRYKEVLVNGIFHPARDFRFRIVGGTTERTSEYGFLSGVQPAGVLQNNMLVDVKKSWGGDNSILNLGATAFSVAASEQELPSAAGDPHRLATGTLQGYALNLGLAPTDRLNLEVGTGIQRVVYDFAHGSPDEENTLSSRLRLTRYLDNCARLQGGYSGDSSADRFDLGVGKGAWSLSASRIAARNGGDNATAFNLRYAIPLGNRRNGPPIACDNRLQTARNFGPVLHTVITRPSELPTAPLAQVDGTATLK